MRPWRTEWMDGNGEWMCGGTYGTHDAARRRLDSYIQIASKYKRMTAPFRIRWSPSAACSKCERLGWTGHGYSCDALRGMPEAAVSGVRADCPRRAEGESHE